MNQRGEHSATEFDRAQNDSAPNPTAQRSFHETIDQQEVVAAYGRRARRSVEGAAEPAAPSPFGREPASDSQQPGYRVRDFRPGSGGQSPATPPATDADSGAEPTRQAPRWAPPAVDHEGQLDYYTQGAPSQLRPPAAPRPVVDSVPSAFAAPPRPLTRRQLRELEASQGIRQQADDAPTTVAESLAEPIPHAPFAMPAVSHPPAPVVSLPIPLIEPGTSVPVTSVPLTPAPIAAERAAVVDVPVVEAPVAKPPVVKMPVVDLPVVETPVVETPVAEVPVVETPEAETPVSSTPDVAPAAKVELAPPMGDPIRLPERPATAQAPQPTASDSAPPPLIAPKPIVFTDAPASAPAPRLGPVPVPAPTPVKPGLQSSPVNRGIDLAPEIFTAPVDHWSNQNHIEVGEQGGDAFIRTVGTHSGALTTSALVMPSIPQASDITKPFGSTGEILVTGSIDLPRTLGSTGAHPNRFDHSDIDALFAEEDHDYAPADAAPVRAIRAVSTHTSTHGVISAKKPPSNRLPMLMAVTAGILAVGVAALFAAGMIFGYF